MGVPARCTPGAGGDYSDIQIIAKGLAVVSADRWNSDHGSYRSGIGVGLWRFLHGQTYQAHPVACAAALEVQRIIREDRLLDNVLRWATAGTALTERFAISLRW